MVRPVRVKSGIFAPLWDIQRHNLNPEVGKGRPGAVKAHLGAFQSHNGSLEARNGDIHSITMEQFLAPLFGVVKTLLEDISSVRLEAH